MEGISLEATFELLDLLDPYQAAFADDTDDVESLTRLLELIQPGDTRRLVAMLEGTQVDTALAGVTDEFELMARMNVGLKTQHVKQMVQLAKSLEIL